jgi:hypothetical protein
LNWPSVASETYFAKSSADPKIVRNVLGKLDVNRHCRGGMDCAMAGAAMRPVAAAAVAAFETKRRLSMLGFLLGVLLSSNLV